MAATDQGHAGFGIDHGRFEIIHVTIDHAGSADKHLEQFADELPCRCRLSHHLSLKDPLLNIFAGEWVQKVLRDMGMPEDEAIQSKMVSRRLKRTQQMIEEKAIASSSAESAAEWLEKNCPELWKK